MASSTGANLNNSVIYSVFVRNHKGTFRGLEADLDRIAGLGTDIIWLMPIHPIGEAGRKGTLGSPYAIMDYRSVNPEYGSRDDFIALVNGIHARGMKCIIDVVYNHTSPDSLLASRHPEWFYRLPGGSFGNKAGDWSDVIDLDYSQSALWDYQIDTLKMWASIVDGFRCDVASLVPVDFWLRARKETEAVREGLIWLAESVETDFVKKIRDMGFYCASDAELYAAFDICYDYDILDYFYGCINGSVPLSRYIEMINRQETAYPANYVKLRFLENHDRPRAAGLFGMSALKNWTAFMFFLKGTALVYAGQEGAAGHTPSLFDSDCVDFGQYELSGLIKALCRIKKHPLMASGAFSLSCGGSGGTVSGVYRGEDSSLNGFFSLDGESCEIETSIQNGEYENLIDGKSISVRDGRIRLTDGPAVVLA